jgi:PAS domain S-box-containing protein
MPDAERRRILVVDDDEIKRYTVTRILEKAGFAVEQVGSGAETLEAARTNPDLIILDVNLPDLSGFEVCRRLKTDPATSSIVVVHFSATLTETIDRIHGLEGGADGYLTEPIGAGELVATVRSMLRVREAERTARTLVRQWRATFDAIADGVALLDERGCVVQCNAAMEAFAGRPASELVGASCADLSQDAAVDTEDLCRQARETRRRVSTEYARDGGWYRVDVHPVFDDAGSATGVVYVVADATEEKRAERERAELLEREQEARAMAESASRAKDDFLATISHELRTPLNSMLGWLVLMRGGTLDAEGMERAIDTLERNARSQAQLISDILDVSRIITGKVRLEAKSVDPARVVESAVEAARPAADAKGVEILSAVDATAGSVAADPERLQQIVWNLLSNAIKFTPKGGRVEVRLQRVDDTVEIVVSDTGVGIAHEFLPYVFERFRQADSSTTRAHGGLGLGLAIVRHLVELHGGTARAESPGKNLGATFTVRLPTSPVSAAARDAGPADGQPEGFITPLDGVRVLVVDDDEDTREMLAAVLDQARATVRTCASAREAVEAITDWKPDVLVSDVGMPGTDGNALIRTVRALSPERGGEVPAIALTAYATADDRTRALAAGFHMFISKPAEPAEVTAAVASLVGRLRAG